MVEQVRDGRPAQPSPTALDPMFAAGGVLGDLIARHDWAATSLGPLRCWPSSLRTAVGICLSSRFPLLIWWGPDLLEFRS